ncbi:MAG: hypothetical protein J2P27_11270 [Actinobacteria bacterium]|nr:hypothetical protein [Actinomycetota bacterium]
MDASPAARRAAFVGLAGALVAVGVYVLGPTVHHGGTSGRPPSAGNSARPAARLPSGAAGAPAPISAVPTGAPAPAGDPAATSADSIYRYLPFSSAGLAAAARIVVQFGDAYGTYSYTEGGPAYIARLAPVTSSQLVGQIESAYEAPGVAAARLAGKQAAVGTTTIGSIRAFGPDSLTFVVQLVQNLTDTSGRSNQVTDYAVTLSGSGTTWQVSDIELATGGNS